MNLIEIILLSSEEKNLNQKRKREMKMSGVKNRKKKREMPFHSVNGIKTHSEKQNITYSSI